MSTEGEQGNSNDSDTILDLTKEGDTGSIDRVRARLRLAYIVLGVVVALLVGAVCVYLFYPDWEQESKREIAEQIFDWATTALFPIITLILGYWFTRDREETG